jgi:predicted P-loop ATPase
VLWFRAQSLGLDTPKEYFVEAVLDIAGADRRHPVREYLGGLKWDGTPRVENWLSAYVGVEDTRYTRAVGKLFLVAAVRRVRRPGVKYDHVLMLYGPQDAGKSSTGAALVPVATWFDDGLILGAETKVVLEQTAGKWIMEINEMRGGKETEAIKAMITRTHDTARKAYARDAVTVPR